MARKRTRLKTEQIADGVRVTCLIKHPMETGNRTGTDGNKVPIHYIKFARFSVNGEHVGTLNLGPGVSADPYLALDVAGAVSGDTVTLEWEDNLGDAETVERQVK